MSEHRITIRVQDVPVDLTLDEATALRLTLDTILRESGRMLAADEPLPGEALGWRAGAGWMQEQVLAVLDSYDGRPCYLIPAVRALALAPDEPRATLHEARPSGEGEAQMSDDEGRRLDRIEDRFELHCRESAAVHAELAEGLTEVKTTIRESRRQQLLVIAALGLLIPFATWTLGRVFPSTATVAAHGQVTR